MIKKSIKSISAILMAGVFFSLPVTNFPFFPPSIGGNSVLVRPLLIYPLAGLVFLIVIPRLISKPIPRPVLIITLFFIWGLVVSILPILKGVSSPWKEVSLIPREIRTIFTLVLGLLLYFSISLYPQTRSDLRSSLKWLYGGLILVLIWGTLQTLYTLDIVPGWFEMMGKVQQFISAKPLNQDRITGMTYEPSAFADQLVVIWLPWIIAASVSNYSVFSWRWKWFTIERILSVWTLMILAFTLSRTGLILGVGVIIFGVLIGIRKTPGDEDLDNTDTQNVPPVKKLVRNYRILLIIFGAVGFLIIFYILGTQVAYINRVWEYFLINREFDLRKYFNYIGFGSRVTYWETAWRIFLDFPIFGVGLGNYAIFFSDYVPFQHLVRTPELLLHLVPSSGRSRVVSVKHFLIRILAEMGIVGFGIFLVFLIVLALMGLYLWRSRNEEERFWGSASLIGMVAFLGDTFSFDSFALPNPWVLFGLTTAAFYVLKNKIINVRENE